MNQCRVNIGYKVVFDWFGWKRIEFHRIFCMEKINCFNFLICYGQSGNFLFKGMWFLNSMEKGKVNAFS